MSVTCEVALVIFHNLSSVPLKVFNADSLVGMIMIEILYSIDIIDIILYYRYAAT